MEAYLFGSNILLPIFRLNFQLKSTPNLEVQGTTLSRLYVGMIESSASDRLSCIARWVTEACKLLHHVSVLPHFDGRNGDST